MFQRAERPVSWKFSNATDSSQRKNSQVVTQAPGKCWLGGFSWRNSIAHPVSECRYISFV